MTVLTVAYSGIKSESDKAVMLRFVSSLLLLLMAACVPDDPAVLEEQDRCFEQYIAEFRGQYPKATLEKTAALKCYRN